jgi:F-type H+-transporting ATPase subunit a
MNKIHKKHRNYLIISILAVLFSVNIAFGQDENTHSEEHKEESGVNITELIMHHIQDAHEWHLFTTGEGTADEHHVSIPLPVILYTENGLEMFMSSAFHHESVEMGGHKIPAHGNYVNHHEHIYYKDTFHLNAEGHAEGAAPLDFSLTKNTVSMMFSAVLLLLIFLTVASKYKKNNTTQAPKGIQALFEPLIEYMIEEVIRPNIGEKKYAKFAPYILTLFFFVWFNNMLGLLPTGANTSGNIAFTMTLAAFTLIVTNISGNLNYWRHIFAMPGVPPIMWIILTPIELISILIKPFALMIRLFANMVAGHSLILSLTGLTFLAGVWWVGIPVSAFVLPMMMLEVFVALLQAYIFATLSALFIGQAVAEHH